MKPTVYIGFAIDMDRAYSDYNTHGNLIPESHPDYIKYNLAKQNFISETNRLIEYFNNNNNFHAATWFVNEPSYNITLYFRDILDKIIYYGGEIGLHTHLNDTRFNGGVNFISNNQADWFQHGIVEPSNRLCAVTNEMPYIFKSGNHMRNEQLFNELTLNNYSIDSTYVINDTNSNDNIVLYDDTDIKFGTAPFFINTVNGVILEIPEIRPSVENCMNHIKQCILNDSPCFLRFQIHHWQYDDLIPVFDDTINAIKKIYNVKFASLYDMQRIYFKQIYNVCTDTILKNIKLYLSNDDYYRSLKNPIGDDLFDVAVYLFNHVKKNSKVLELFSGIGQCTYFLEKIGFSNTTILDFDKTRVNWLKKYLDTGIQSVEADFFTYDIDSYDVVFCSNSINSCLCQNIDVQIEKYNKYLEQSLPSVEQNKILILNKKYGSYDPTTFNKILDGLNHFNKIYIGEYIVLQKVEKVIENFSKFFMDYKTINFNNIKHNVMIFNNKKIIQLNMETDINPSAGVFFPVAYKYPGIKKNKCTLSFSARCNSDINGKFKVYTGSKWIVIDKNISTEFQQYEITDDFDFVTSSTYRIGFNTVNNTTVFITDIDIVTL